MRLSYIELYKNMRYEGHPALWHLCLYGQYQRLQLLAHLSGKLTKSPESFDVYLAQPTYSKMQSQ